MRAFYTSPEGDRSRLMLKSNGIDFVWWGGYEDILSPRRPPDLSYLQKAYARGGVTIYRVIREAL